MATKARCLFAADDYGALARWLPNDWNGAALSGRRKLGETREESREEMARDLVLRENKGHRKVGLPLNLDARV